MKLIIAGSRTIHPSTGFLHTSVKHFEPFGKDKIEEVVSGCCDGVDKAGEAWATHLGITIKRFPADWIKHGRAAGPYRNMDMAAYADALLLIWDGQSRGSANMKQCMLNKGKPVYEVILSRTKS